MLKCAHAGDAEAYTCPVCAQCLCCRHAYVQRADGWYARCPGGKWRPCRGPGCCHGLGDDCPDCGKVA